MGWGWTRPRAPWRCCGPWPATATGWETLQRTAERSLPGGPVPEGIAGLRAEVAGYDEKALGSQGYGHERLDQLVTELLLGVR